MSAHFSWLADRVSLSVTIRSESRNDVTHPAEQSTGSNPDSRGDDEPEDSAKYPAVVDLPYAWDEEAQNRCYAWVSHFASA